MWLPLALAEIATELRVIIRMFASKPEGVKVPRLSEYLSGWALPMMSAACKTDEEASDALAMMRAVERMANAQKGTE